MPGLAPGFRFSNLLIQLGDLVFNQVDSGGVHWYCASITGWDSPDVRADLTVREQDDGAWPVQVFYGARPITLAGKILAPSAFDADQAIEQLIAAASPRDTTLIVNETIPKQATVRRSGAVMAQRTTDTVVDWSVMVTAPDPRRYGVDEQSATTGLPVTTGGLAPPLTPPLLIDATTTAGQIVATNTGSMETRPVLVIDGPVVAPRIIAEYPDGTVRSLAYSRTLADGEQLVIDTDAHTVLLNGQVSRRGFLTVPSDWPTIGPAETVIYAFAADVYSATARLTARWRSAWA